MATITIELAQAKLPDLLHGLRPGENLLISENGKPLAIVTRPVSAS